MRIELQGLTKKFKSLRALDGVSLAYAWLLCLLAALVTGLMLAFQSSRTELSDALNQTSRTSTAPARLTAPASGLFLETVRYAGEPRQANWCVATPLIYSSRTPSTSRTTSP